MNIKLISILIIIISLITSSFGFFMNEGDSYLFQTIRNETISIYGKGLYKHDSILIGSGNRGTDFILLFFIIPLTLISTFFTIQNSFRWKIILCGLFGYYLYLYITFTLSINYNRLFILYIILFGLSFFGFYNIFSEIYQEKIFNLFPEKYEKKWIGTLLLIIGIFVGLLWSIDPLITLITGKFPKLEHYPTLFTHGLDLSTILPICIISGYKIFNNNKSGYILSFPILFILGILVLNLISMTIMQYKAGLIFNIQEIIVFIISFLLMGIPSIIALINIILNLPNNLND